MNRHNGYQQPEATANNANAKQWQIDVPEQGASKVGNYGNASDVNGGKNANDINHISDQGETVEVRVIKDDRDEPNNDEPGQVEQGGQAGQAVQTDTEAQPRKRGMIELLGSSPLGVMAQTAFDSVRRFRTEKQASKQIRLINNTSHTAPDLTKHYSKEEILKQQQGHAQLNQLVEDGKLDLSEPLVLRSYMWEVRLAISDETAESDSKFISKMLQEGKINLSDPKIAKEFLDTSEYSNNRYLGMQGALGLGKLDLSNEDIRCQFLDSLDDVKADSVALLDASGLPIEEIAANEHIRQVIVDETSKRVCLMKANSYDNDELSSADKAGDSYRLGVIDAICATDEGKQYLTNSINKASGCENIQDVGKEIEDNILQGINSEGKWLYGIYGKWYDQLTHNSALIQNVAKYNSVLKKLGWEPFKDGTSLAELFDHRSAKQSEAIQRRANQLGLITPEVTDRLYTYQYHKLLNKAKKGEVDVDSETFGYTIDPDLTPSGNDSIANYWYEQSKLAGGDAMHLCMKYTSDAIQNDDIPDTSEFIKEDGTMQDAFFRNRKGSLLQDIYAYYEIYYNDKNEEVLKFLEAHENQASEADGSKAMINMLSKMKDEDGKYYIEAMRELQFNIGRFCTEAPDKLFNEGKPTDEFYSLAFKQSFYYGEEYIDSFMSYVDSDWKDHYGDVGRKYLELVPTYPSWSDAFSDERTEWIKNYLDAGGPTNELFDGILLDRDNITIFGKHPEWQVKLADDKKSLVKFCEECNLGGYSIREYGITADNLADYFDADGPMPEFLQKIFIDGDYGVIYKYYQSQDEAGRERMGLDDKQIAVAKGAGNIGGNDDSWNSPRRAFRSYIEEHYDELTIDQIGQTANIVARLASSNASELAERSEAFAGELLKLDLDKIPEVLTRIEDIYIHNHLPYVGKNYLVFRTMHPSDNLEEDFDFSPILSYGEPNTISPVLQQATGDLKSGKLDQMLNSRDTIIISDLLRASLGSNNRSIREYLTTLKNGQTLLDQLSSGELDWSTFNQPTNLMDKDTKASYDTLSTFAWHLATIYSSTLPGKEHPYQLIHQQPDQSTKDQSIPPNALQADFTNLTSLIKPGSRYTLADRAVRYFAHFVGIEDLAGAERYMDNVVKEADARNRRTAEYLATTSDPKLQPGDLVKGMGGTDGYGIRYLSYAFQNGSISKEYLGDASRSDTTPLDADASIVLHGERTINQTMASMLAEGYGGGLWTVLRPDKDRFIITRRDKHEADQSVYDLSVPDANFDRTDLSKEEIDRRLSEIAEAKRHRREGLPKLEAFATEGDGVGHYGIRTGFGMDKVDYCVTDSTRIDSTPVSEVTKLEIALGGFYIPIIDKDSEELIFTPADYDKMREQMSGLSYYHTGDYQFAPDSELELPSTNVKETVIPGTSTIISELPTSMAETDRKHEVINQTIKQAITGIPELNLSYKDYLDGDLTENIVEMIDTGSTGRQTNAPGSGDFDYLARLDRSILNDPTKKQQITDALLAAFGRENDGSAIVNGNLRLKQVSIDGLAEPVDIDITFAQKTNKVQYPTDAALADRLTNIKNQSETKYQQVLANIIYAKQFLKAAGAYKPRRSPEAKGIGGLGGVGIENWVLQHGGSFKQAARDFLAVADNCSGFEDFCAHYPVWDYGENHKGIKSKPHDNFVADNMNPEGYERMKEALRAVVN